MACAIGEKKEAERLAVGKGQSEAVKLHLDQ